LPEEWADLGVPAQDAVSDRAPDLQALSMAAQAPAPSMRSSSRARPAGQLLRMIPDARNPDHCSLEQLGSLASSELLRRR
jgi:hypothetical protein